MANTDIFLGSGASLTFVPEVDFYLPVVSFTGDTTSGSANIANVSVAALTDLTVGTPVSGAGIPNGTTILTLTDNDNIVLSKNATATATTVAITGTNDVMTKLNVATSISDNFDFLNSLYVGCILERYNTSDVLQSTHRITANDSISLTFSPSVAATSTDYFIMRGYGAPCPAPTSTAKRLLADEWLGLLESATFPTTEVEVKQQNLFLGGTRNMTYQYKGIETANGGSLGVVANHGAWLYYFFGRCSTIAAITTTGAVTDEFGDGAVDGKYYLETTPGAHVETGPLFYRTVGTGVLCPPLVKGQDTPANMDILTQSTVSGGTIANGITYTFTEQDTDDLPSFALEQVMSKLPSTNTYRTNTAAADEDLNFVKIARGNRVNSLSMTANENEEVKMTLELNSRAIHALSQTEEYDARRGVTDETTFVNYDSESTFREPFFFSSGSFKIFGQQFLKITSMTLTMNNNLADRRFIGVGNKSIKEGIPANRTYELQFNGLVTDDKLYTELVNNAENTSANYVELIFEKANGEKITLQFKDYMISANNFPIPDDKGPIEVETTVMPRNLQSCSVITHWILQG